MTCLVSRELGSPGDIAQKEGCEARDLCKMQEATQNLPHEHIEDQEQASGERYEAVCKRTEGRLLTYSPLQRATPEDVPCCARPMAATRLWGTGAVLLAVSAFRLNDDKGRL